jgi:hypothetical protein
LQCLQGPGQVAAAAVAVALMFFAFQALHNLLL